MIRQTKSILAFVAAASLAVGIQKASALTIDFANVPGGAITFYGGGSDTFNFTTTNPSGYDLTVTDVLGGVGDSITDKGTITGTFTIGPISNNGSGQYAPVTGSGTMNITDGTNNLSGNLVWDSIATNGTGGTINVNGLLNLTGITYSGHQSDLVGLASHMNAYEAITFQFVPGMSLSQLTTSGGSTSFSGTITVPTASVPDGGSTVALLGLALVGVTVAGQRLGNGNVLKTRAA